MRFDLTDNVRFAYNLRMDTSIDIKKLREARGWTQGDMADHFGVNKSTVWRWEHEGIPVRGVTRKAIEREWGAANEGLGATE